MKLTKISSLTDNLVSKTFKLAQPTPPPNDATGPNVPPETPPSPVPPLDEFTKSYIETALWSSTDNSTPQGGEPLDKNYTIDDISTETISNMIDDCEDFQKSNFDYISSNPARAGHDFWLTRNRHGAGFWDGEWNNDPDWKGTGSKGDFLTHQAHAYGEFNLYIGDDGKIHGG